MITCLCTPWQNVIVEPKYRHLLDIIRNFLSLKLTFRSFFSLKLRTLLWNLFFGKILVRILLDNKVSSNYWVRAEPIFFYYRSFWDVQLNINKLRSLIYEEGKNQMSSFIKRNKGCTYFLSSFFLNSIPTIQIKFFLTLFRLREKNTP